MDRTREVLKEIIRTTQTILNDEAVVGLIDRVSSEITNALKKGRTVYFCGNGGSAADAQHLSAELSGRFYFDRDPLPAEALHGNTSAITAIANDYSYDEIYSRLLKGKARAGDVLVAISTSGNSTNILKAASTGREKGLIVVGLTGDGGGKMKDVCNYTIMVPSKDTARIQEAHIAIGHIICERVEKNIFSKE